MVPMMQVRQMRVSVGQRLVHVPVTVRLGILVAIVQMLMVVVVRVAMRMR